MNSCQIPNPDLGVGHWEVGSWRGHFVIIARVLDQARPADIIPDERPIFAAPRAILPVERIAAGLEVFLCSGVPTQILLVWVLYGLGLSVMTPDGQLSPTPLFIVSLLDTVLIVGPVVVISS